jgi:uncharacterized OB-fold protein
MLRLDDGEESERVDEELRDIAWNLMEERSHMMKCRDCGTFYIPKEAPPDGMGVCTFCCIMEEFDDFESR